MAIMKKPAKVMKERPVKTGGKTPIKKAKPQQSQTLIAKKSGGPTIG